MAFIFEERDSVLFHIRKSNNDRLVKTEFIVRGDEKYLHKCIKYYMHQKKKKIKKNIDISNNVIT